jgi:hypothetical protein
MGRSSKIHKLKAFLRKRASTMSSLLPTHLNKMVLWRGRIELYWTWQGPCLMSTKHQTGFGRKQSTLLAILKKTSYELLTDKKPNSHILESLVANVLFLLKEVENLNFLPRL